MKFYQLPPGAYPHDVAPAPDGSVWISGQRQGFAGRFDPNTGQLEKIPLGPGAAPHGVIIGPDGNAWLTEGGQNAIARVDARSREVKLFPLPKDFPGANLNTMAFDQNGIAWFTGQGGVYGRVDPRTGKVDAWKAPRGVGPYGITATPAGDVWYASLAGDHIAREAGEPIAALTLEHYPGMAEAEVARHVEAANARWGLLGVTVIHRYGRIEPGENIVLVVTAASHRHDAFAAAEFLMDYLKTRAPFWKSEERTGGARWVEAQQSDDAAADRWAPAPRRSEAAQ
ncbi:MAG: hypothetical protein E6G75_00525 [Alphaproteobacteria bacterium]|nr:MAG: hypothetical protein E6G75_00525 [Alphaproteobacteria bacterium]